MHSYIGGERLRILYSLLMLRKATVFISGQIVLECLVKIFPTYIDRNIVGNSRVKQYTAMWLIEDKGVTLKNV